MQCHLMHLKMCSVLKMWPYLNTREKALMNDKDNMLL